MFPRKSRYTVIVAGDGSVLLLTSDTFLCVKVGKTDQALRASTIQDLVTNVATP